MAVDLSELRAYIGWKLPILDKALGPFGRNDIRLVMNAATGLDVEGSASISATVPLYIAELKRQDERGTLLLDALPKAMKAVSAIRKLKQAHYGG